MRRTQTRPRGRFGRLLVATLILASVPALLPSVAAARSTQQALADANAANRLLKRTLAGAVIELDGRRLCIEAAPARRKPPRRTAAGTR